MNRVVRRFLAAAILTTWACRSYGLASAAAAYDRKPDPLVFKALVGPFPSLRGFCQAQVKDNGPRFWTQDCPDSNRLQPFGAPPRAASFVHFQSNWKVEQDHWRIEGKGVEAKGFRGRLAAAVGEHLVALP